MTAIVAAAVIVLPLLDQPRRGHDPRMRCAVNLKQIGLALLMYSDEHDGYFPPTPKGNNFEPLNREQLLNNSKVYGCPGSTDFQSTAENSAYLYMGSGLKDDNKNATTVSLAMDQSGNHAKDNWINVLFLDGHVDGHKADGSKGWNQFPK